MNKFTIRDFTQVALVAAIYVVLTVTPPLNAISYGAYQFRVSEMLVFLAFYNRKYIAGITLGCMIANLYSFGLIDVVVGGSQTFVFLTLGVILFDRYKDQYLFNGLFNKAFFYFSLLFAASMFTSCRIICGFKCAILDDLVHISCRRICFLANWLTCDG